MNRAHSLLLMLLFIPAHALQAMQQGQGQPNPGKQELSPAELQLEADDNGFVIKLHHQKKRSIRVRSNEAINSHDIPTIQNLIDELQTLKHQAVDNDQLFLDKLVIELTNTLNELKNTKAQQDLQQTQPTQTKAPSNSGYLSNCSIM
ncbi:hypothetical protein H0X48_01795 [Candidatus Dependentiae bacterium]|nr:hypothetical protein [Candidatus Dependentiae bacterium]